MECVVNILVTGGAGYLGAVLIPKLLVRGHKVRVLDIGYFGVGHLRGLQPGVELIREDIRRVRRDGPFLTRLLDGCECIVHLAAISNDPSAELHPELTEEVNYQATEALAQACKARGTRFVFSSSCSVYGEAGGELTETGPVAPLTVYAVSKVKAERLLGQMATSSWRPVVLRNGTLFGYSPRMRFDLVINIFSLYGALFNEIKVFGEGRQWRPFLHVGDCARAFVHFSERPVGEHLVYNISHENLRVIDLVEVFRDINPRITVKFVPMADPDLRDYRVSTARMIQAGFRTQVGVRLGAEQLLDAIISGLIPDPESIFYRNAKWLKELQGIGSRDHKDILHLIEAMSALRAAGAERSACPV
jgi:nucleoside-diphosphate-sugar epimerase